MRLDALLVQLQLSPSRERAKELIRNGQVSVNGKIMTKPAFEAEPDSDIRIIGETLAYVSRGGLKLAHALDHFDISLEDLTCIDIGASTGGFTDVMLKRGARHVYAIDSGTDQLHGSLRNDPRVTSLEKTNIRYFELSSLPAPADFIAIDVSFISLKLVLPKAFELLKAGGACIALIKPQFEAGKQELNKHGIVRSDKVREVVIKDTADFAAGLGFIQGGILPSPITGGDGNKEYLIWLKKPE